MTLLTAVQFAQLSDNGRRQVPVKGMSEEIDLGFPEFNTVSLSELAQSGARAGLGIERNLHFEADKPISAYIEEADHLGNIKARSGVAGPHRQAAGFTMASIT